MNQFQTGRGDTHAHQVEWIDDKMTVTFHPQNDVPLKFGETLMASELVFNKRGSRRVSIIQRFDKTLFSMVESECEFSGPMNAPCVLYEEIRDSSDWPAFAQKAAKRMFAQIQCELEDKMLYGAGLFGDAT